MKQSILIFLFLFPVFMFLHAQDSIIYENIYRHQIKNGQSTTKSHIAEQNTYNLDKDKVISLQYHDTLPDVTVFTLYFYRNGLLFSEETFDMKKNPLSIIRYSYSKNGLKTEKKDYKPVGNDMQCMKTITWAYKDTLPVKKTVKDESGKKTSKTAYRYTDDKNMENTKFLKRNEAVYPVSASCVTIYSNGRKVTWQSDTTYSDGSSQTTTVEYSYDDTIDRLVNESWYNGQHEPIKTVEYKWKSDGTLSGKGTYEPSGNCMEYLSYKHQSHVVDLGDRKPYPLSTGR